MDYETQTCVIGNRLNFYFGHHGLKIFTLRLIFDLQCSNGVMCFTYSSRGCVRGRSERGPMELGGCVWQAVLTIIQKKLFFYSTSINSIRLLFRY